MITIGIIISLYCVEIGFMSIIHAINSSRMPKNIWDLICMTFAPYALFKLKNYKL